MITIKTSGMPDVKLTEREAFLLYTALYKQVEWEAGGMFGDGDTITDKVGYKMALRILSKINYR